MKTKRPTKTLDPAEWDFRSITEDQVWTAEIYEYARESDWLRAALDRWLKTPMQDFDFAGEDEDGELVAKALGREILVELMLKKCPLDFYGYLKFHTLPEEIKNSLYSNLLEFTLPGIPAFQKWSAGMRGARFLRLGLQLISSLPFGPWTRRASFSTIYGGSQSTFSTTPKPEEYGIKKGIGTYAVKVNHTAPRKQIIKDFTQWLTYTEQFNNSKDIKKKETRGRTNVPPFESLRWLSAYRLSRCGKMRYEDAQKFLKNHQKAHPNTKDQYGFTLPLYASTGAWSTAIKKAESRLQKLFPPPESSR